MRHSWHFILTDLDSVTLSFLGKSARNRRAAFTLNDESVAEGVVPSDSPSTKTLHTDGAPFLARNLRLLYGFRKEETDAPKYTCRFGGTVNIVDDQGDENAGTSHYTAYDPWRYLKSRPVLNESGLFPINGIFWNNVKGSAIAKALLQRTDVAHGTCRVDYGQTAFYRGTIEDTDEIDLHVESGTSVGEAWTQLTDTGTLDIVLTPIYDPNFRPGFVAELNIYQRAGSLKPSAIFAWDRAPHSLVGVGRTVDGTTMANKVLFYTGDGTPVALQTDATSVADFGQYWLEKSISEEYSSAATTLLAQAELRLRKLGKTTVTIDATPGRSPSPFTEYFCGDKPSIFASDRLRLPLGAEGEDALRVYGVPIDIADDGTEMVNQVLLASPFEGA